MKNRRSLCYFVLLLAITCSSCTRTYKGADVLKEISVYGKCQIESQQKIDSANQRFNDRLVACRDVFVRDTLFCRFHISGETQSNKCMKDARTNYLNCTGENETSRSNVVNAIKKEQQNCEDQLHSKFQ